MTTVERLTPENYGQLLTVEEGWSPDPANSIVVVAREGNRIVGRTMLVRPFHVEGTWVDEDFRYGMTGIRLLKELEKQAKTEGLTKILAYAMEKTIEGYLQRMGYRKSILTVWEKAL